MTPDDRPPRFGFLAQDCPQTLRAGMAEFAAEQQPFRYGEAFRVFRFDLPWEPPRADPEAPLSEA